MDYQSIWSTEAKEDLEEIVSYIALDRPKAAARVRAKILKRVRLLQEFPLLGMGLSRSPRARIRQIVSGKYRVIYEVYKSKKLIKIHAIWHGAREDPLRDQELQ